MFPGIYVGRAENFKIMGMLKEWSKNSKKIRKRWFKLAKGDQGQSGVSGLILAFLNRSRSVASGQKKEH